MMVADKPQSIPLGPSHSSGNSQQRQNSKKAVKVNNVNQNPRQRPPKPKVQQQPPQQKSKQNVKSKASANLLVKKNQNQPQGETQQQQKQQQKQKQPKTNEEGVSGLAETSSNQSKQSQSSTKNNKNSNNKQRRVVIPPRNVQVDFHSNKSSNMAILKDTSDDLKQSAADVKDLLLSELSLGKKSTNRNDNRNAAKSPLNNIATLSSNSEYSLYNNQSLPDGSSPNFGHGTNLSRSSSSSSTANRSKLTSASSYNSEQTNVLKALENFNYAGSSFTAEPKAVTLPKPSFLRSK